MKRAIKVLAIATLVGTLFGLYFYLFHDRRFSTIVNAVLFSVCIGSLTMTLIYSRNRFLSWTNSPIVRIILMMFGLALVAIAGTELAILISAVIYGLPHSFLNAGQLYFLNVVVVLTTGLPFYAQEEWNTFMDNRALKKDYELLKLEQLKTLSDLETLRAKINPHFLYNVHNTIVGLIRDEPEKAEKMTILLSKFFRSTLTRSSSTFHSINEEMEIVRTYLDMQKIRFGDKLNVIYEMSENSDNRLIPSFIIQPLVENSLKHGIEKSNKPGFVKVILELQGIVINILIEDSGPPFPEGFEFGIGLTMIKQKLDLLCGNNYKIIFNNKPQKSVQISITANDYSIGG